MISINKFLRGEQQLEEHQEALVVIVYTANQILKNLEQVLKPHSLTTSQYNLLLILKGKYPEYVSIQKIADSLLERSDVPRLIHRLQLSGMVKVEAKVKGQRTKRVSLTDKGLEKLKVISVNHLPQIEKPIAAFTPAEAEQLNNMLRKILKTLGEKVDTSISQDKMELVTIPKISAEETETGKSLDEDVNPEIDRQSPAHSMSMSTTHKLAS